MGVNERPSVTEGDEKLVPLENHGIKLMSMGFLLQDDQPVIWRGPMIMRTIQQFISQVLWGNSTTCSSTCRPAPAMRRFRFAKPCHSTVASS